MYQHKPDMLEFITRHALVRLVSLALLPILMGITFFFYGDPGPSSAAVCLISCSALMLSSPTSAGNIKISFFYVLFGAAAWLILYSLRLSQDLLVLASIAFVLLYYLLSTLLCLNDIRERMKSCLAWKAMELFAKMFYSLVFMALCATVLSLSSTLAGWLELAFSALLLAALYVRARQSVTLLFPVELERLMKRMVHSGLRDAALSGAKSENKMERVYMRSLEAVESKKLYLRNKYTLYDLSREVYCNKALLSRAINAYSGMNFSRFMNAYRIAYAKDLMRKDPRLMKKEVAMMSGFQNVVTFNFAFKDLTGETPTEFTDKIKVEALKRPSTPRG